MLLRSLLMALSTYSIFPVPQMDWDPRSWKYAICWFPGVGILIGGIMALWILAVSMCGLSRLLYSCVSVCLPLLLTGGIHMDG